jgi:hypothetical protein
MAKTYVEEMKAAVLERFPAANAVDWRGPHGLDNTVWYIYPDKTIFRAISRGWTTEDKAWQDAYEKWCSPDAKLPADASPSEPQEQKKEMQRWAVHYDSMPHTCQDPIHCDCNCEGCVGSRGFLVFVDACQQCTCDNVACPHCGPRIADRVMASPTAAGSEEPKPIRTECCQRPIDGDERYCPRCGWECRIEFAPPFVRPRIRTVTCADGTVLAYCSAAEVAAYVAAVEVILVEAAPTAAGSEVLPGRNGHFVPPSLGEYGFSSCKAAPVASQAPAPKRPLRRTIAGHDLFEKEAFAYMDYLEGRVRELEAEKARMFYWVHYDCTNENCAGDGENCPGKRIEANHE